MTDALKTDRRARPGITYLDPLMRRGEVERTTGLTTSALYRLVKLGDFPKPYQITPGTVGWRTSEVARWLNERPLVNL